MIVTDTVRISGSTSDIGTEVGGRFVVYARRGKRGAGLKCARACVRG